ncbi:MAG: ArsR family transcriptional regulator [Saprospiraceae bacterium]
MEFKEGKALFVMRWGLLGTEWGINRTMAQIHAILLISPKPLCTEDLMQELQISRGNTSMNLKALLDWEIIHKTHIKGDRKEYYVAEKDIWTILRQVIKQRKRKELDPMVAILQDVVQVQGVCEKSSEFCRMVQELRQFSDKADVVLDHLVESNPSWLSNTFFKLIR